MSISKAASNLSLQSTAERLQIEYLINSTAPTNTSDGNDVIQGLTKKPKSLPARYFYDDRGSQLFEQICDLSEYYLTRTETAILQECAIEIARITGACELIELGSGSSTKTRILLDAYNQLGYPLYYLPVDVSAGILKSSAQQLLTDYPSLQVHALVSTYELALEKLMAAELPSRMICFIGSTLGNLSPQECELFLSQITCALLPKEYFLLGVDLQKPKDLLEAAYNDSQGVTAAFNLNMLEHLNERFDGDFDLQQFKHWAFYNESQHQIEMHLRSLRSQTVFLSALDTTVQFAPEETILTEISRKFNLNTLQQILAQQGLTTVKVWTDSQQWFALLLCQLQA
ncbi:L-histidine N(alpha)-methyltransferase [Gloeocapsopsis sp. IPPAS B-1203]|uniref:L-histidine N(alpha)-methyltransferase n=1 Tax=Gloeocapsopsis sp. IPPAS B-1203 TaxID=2049454 RepID=UPI000C17DD54|nr:L-histidine N(alpha)-methyltransferase [Gloeocapsopsis sp. IPPAS B-1203]PIG91886.1 L-histidine N(alpha)-methyltransferase [Gloeocapsopsis sp. IPPAS B-1203]